jgi:cytidyltransferase-like protein
MSESSVVVIGVFDGVHKGHQLLLNHAKEIADGRSIVALTFDPHPTTVFAPDKAPTMLTTLADRVELLKIHNADQVAVMKFNEKFAAMSAQDFVQTVLVNQLHASTVIVGKNFTYGHKAAGSVDTLIKSGLTHNFTVDVQELKADTEVISSSRIRKLVIEGVDVKLDIRLQILEILRDRQFQQMVCMQDGSLWELTSGRLLFQLEQIQHLKALVVDKLRHMHLIKKALSSMTRTLRLNSVGICVPHSNLMALNHFLSR